jgi:hypothetical protein
MTKIIKRSSVSKKPYIKHNHTVYFGFKIGSLPKRFNNLASRVNITSWFNHSGFTFIDREYFRDPRTNEFTIE